MPAFCISTFASSVQQLEKRISKARSYSPFFIEIRLDYLKSPDLEGMLHIKKLLSGNEILTLRSSDEGGAGNFEEKVRIQGLHEIASHVKPRYMDVEVRTLTSHPDLARDIQRAGINLIASSHDFKNTESASELVTLVKRMSKIDPLYAVKVVRNAAEFKDNYSLLSLYRHHKKRKTALISFCAGQLGIFSRLVCTQFGSPFTYVSLPGAATAPGQLDIETVRALFSSRKE